jgi:NAD(P)-dependent dehydrogenase (short-subunit alcohol dehydrogenase family)
MGLATARILGSDHHAVIADVDQQRLDQAVARLSEDGVDVVAARCDITSRKSVEDLFHDAAADGPTMGRLEEKDQGRAHLEGTLAMARGN